MKPKTYPDSILNKEKSFISDYLLNEKGHLKAPAVSAIPEALQGQLKAVAINRGILNSENITECIYWVINDLTDYPKKCISCNGNITKFHSFSRGYPHQRCSTKCSNSDTSVKKRKKKTSLEKYGTEFPWQNQEIKSKSRKAFVNNWFERRFAQFSPEYTPITIKEQYEGSKTKFIWQHRCGHVFEEYMTWKNLKPMCPACRPDSGSRQQRDIIDFIKSIYQGNVVSNDRRTIWPLELDVYLPEKKIAIEYHGLYWHSYSSPETPEQKNKHKRKADICDTGGIKLIQIWEHEWREQQHIVKSRLKSIIGVDERIFARKCQIKLVDSKDAVNFQEELHIQGSAQSSIRIGLYLKDKLVALMTFGKPRFSKQYQWELIRYCSKGTIVGGASKLLRHFIREYSPSSIVTYADRRWSTGNMYKVLGFKKLNATSPNYFYFKGSNRFPRYAFQKHKLHKFLEIFDNSKTEYENAFANEYRRVWDAGNHVLVWRRE